MHFFVTHPENNQEVETEGGEVPTEMRLFFVFFSLFPIFSRWSCFSYSIYGYRLIFILCILIQFFLCYFISTCLCSENRQSVICHWTRQKRTLIWRLLLRMYLTGGLTNSHRLMLKPRPTWFRILAIVESHQLLHADCDELILVGELMILPWYSKAIRTVDSVVMFSTKLN